MPPQTILLVLEAAAYAFTAWRLFARQLAGKQKALVLFLFSRCLLTALMTGLSQHSPLYFWTYVIGTPIVAVVSIAAVREAIGLVLQDYKGMKSMVRRMTYAAVAIAVLSTALTGALAWRGSQVSTNLYYIEVLNRSIMQSLGAIVALLVIFLSRYNVQMDSNRIVSSVAFGVLMSSEAITLYFDSMAQHLNVPVVDLASVAVGAVCVFTWGSMLKTKEDIAREQKKELSEHDLRMLAQLAMMERAVSGFGRRSASGLPR